MGVRGLTGFVKSTFHSAAPIEELGKVGALRFHMREVPYRRGRCSSVLPWLGGVMMSLLLVYA